jgi:hypothetical protein
VRWAQTYLKGEGMGKAAGSPQHLDPVLFCCKRVTGLGCCFGAMNLAGSLRDQ